jgi:hypothetical protein
MCTETEKLIKFLVHIRMWLYNDAQDKQIDDTLNLSVVDDKLSYLGR